jgi:RHS repeat-associated protein
MGNFGVHRFAAALLASSAISVPVIAQQSPTGPAPLHSNVDDNGVDLVNGFFRYSFTEGVIGSGDGAVALTRSWGEGVWRDNWGGGLYPATDGNYYIDFGNIADSFSQSGGVFTSRTGNGATLVGNGVTYTYTAADGTTVFFSTSDVDTGDPLQGFSCPNGTQAGACALPMLITRPTGLKFNINWTIVLKNGIAYYRLGGVDSSAGYGFSITYLTNLPGPGSAPQSNWYVKTGITFSNTATPCDASCPAITYPAGTGGTDYVTDALGRTWEFDKPNGNLTGIKRPGESTASTTVVNNGPNFTVSSITRDGITTNYSRTVVGSTATTIITDPLGHSKTVTADTSIDQIKSIKDELNHTTSYQYDTSGRLTDIIYPEGNKLHYTYDGRGNITEARAISKTPGTPADIVSSASYPATCTNPKICNEPTNTTDPKSNVTDYTYDANHGGVLTVTRPAPATGAIRPQSRASYTQVTSASGDLVYMLTGTSACQTLASCPAASDETKSTLAYNSNLVPTTVTRANGTGTLSATDAIGYDPAGNLLTDDGPLTGTADTTRYRYDADRELIGLTSPDPDGAGTGLPNRAIRLTYRPDGQVNKQEIGTVVDQSDPAWANFAPLQTVDVTFDGNSRPVTAKLSASGTNYALTQTSYDALGRADCTAQRMNPAVYASLPGSACTLSTQGSFGPDRISQLVYDNASEVTQVKVGVATTDAATERTLTYSNNGMLASLKDAENNLTTFEYDGFDRPSKARYPSPAKGSGTSSTTDYEQLSYDANSNVTSWRLRDTTSIAFTYDKLDRVTLKNLPGTEPDVTYGYDNLDRLTSAIQTGNNLSFTWDALSRKLTEAGPQGTTSFGYDLADRRTSITYPSATALTINYAYLVTGELDTIKQSTTVLADYTYDNLGSRIGVTFNNGASQNFSYDPVSRLSQLTNSLTDTNDLTATFSYNPASQITQTVRTGDMYAWTGHSNQSKTGTANGLNQLTAYGGSNLSHDNRGNVTAFGTNSFGYSSENLLTSGPNTTTLSYDPGTRLYQTASGATTSRFAYDDTDMLAEYNGSNALQRRWVFDPTTGQPVVWYEGTGTASTNRRYLSTDERGSIVSVSGNTGASLGINTYDEYGIPQSGGTNLLFGRFGYTGQAWLPEVALYYYTARVYDSELGRLLQTDPAGMDDDPNLYAYVLDDPVNWIDPSGLQESPITITGQRVDQPFGYGFAGSGMGNFGIGGGFTLPSIFFGDVAIHATPLPAPPRRNPASCDPRGCDVGVVISGRRKDIPFIVVGGRYVYSGYQKPWWSNRFDVAVGAITVAPAALIGAVEAGGAIATVDTVPASVGYLKYGRGTKWQVRLFRNFLKIRYDVRRPITHLNIEIGSHVIHIPPW